MDAMTPSERRGALVLVCLLALGAGHDLWRAWRPPPDSVPAQSESAMPEGPADPAGAGLAPPDRGRPGDAQAPPTPVDLNRATVQDLDALPGIGPVLASRIIAYREAHGPFRSREDLMGVRGIGPRLFARLSLRIGVGPQPKPGLQTAAPDSQPVQIPVQPTGRPPDNRR